MAMEKTNRAAKIILSLIIVIILLIGVLAYFLWAKPAFDNYILQKQIEAKDIVLSSLLSQVQQQGYVQIFDKDGNTIILAPVKQQQASSQ